MVERSAEGRYALRHELPRSIGRLHGDHGNVGMLVRAYAYVRALGPEGLRRATELAVLNANYLLARLRGTYHVPYDAARAARVRAVRPQPRGHGRHARSTSRSG